MDLTDVALTREGPPNPGGAPGRAEDEEGGAEPGAEEAGAPTAASLGDRVLAGGEDVTGFAVAATTGEVLAALPPQISAADVVAVFLLAADSSTPKAPKRMLPPPASPPALIASHCPSLTRLKLSAVASTPPSSLSGLRPAADLPAPMGARRCCCCCCCC